MSLKKEPNNPVDYVTEKMRSWAGYCGEKERVHEADDFAPTDPSGYDPWECAYCYYQISAGKHMFLKDLEQTRDKLQEFLHENEADSSG